MKTALLLIDFQNDYFPGFEGAKWPLNKTEEAAQQAVKLLTEFRRQGLPVIHVRHQGAEDAPFFVAGTAGMEIHEWLAPTSGETVITKQQINSFLDTELHQTLKALDVSSLVIVGAMSHMCIDAVVRAAADMGYQCSVAHDACTTRDQEFNGLTVTAEQVHAVFMASLAFAYATVNSTDSLVEELKQERLVAAAKAASQQWQKAFNAGDAEGCADQYQADAVMNAIPFGRYEGREDILSFWRNLIKDGFKDVEYISPSFEVLDTKRVLLKSQWKMNNAGGVIHKELWVLQEDGSCKLAEDDFEVIS
ncbi:isochorismatase family protein [Litoribacillus peritrichatus]|uniref:Isochorismatase n=1 Tax=Litoribacillus peritrichatus TaxID=718191 RepID=A0ABP7MQP6_9GAMM